MISVVVVNYRTPQDLDRFLRSFSEFPPTGDHELAVVNSGCLPDDAATAGRWRRRFPLRQIDFEDNIGYARACNFAASMSHGDVLAFFNADVVLAEGAVDSCVVALTSREDWAVLGPRQRTTDGRLVHAGIVGPDNKPRHRSWLEVDRTQWSGVDETVPMVSGSAFFVKRPVWTDLTECPAFREIAPEALGALLPTPHYYEETWLCYHARAHGYRCVYYGPVTVTHDWHRASPRGGFADRQMPVSRAMFRTACDIHGIEGC